VQVKYDAAEAQEEKGMRVALGVLRHAGIRCTPVKRSEKRAAMHNKFAVVDRKLVLTGSYNYTSAGTLSNDENLVSIRSEAVAEAFRRRFLALKDR
jgi:phosphatidylserine/phosphatidylglycerophosphate/cardiolipin synthase-like enzyme